VLSLEGDDGAHRARLAGLAHVPEDRQTDGLVIPFEAWEYNILGYQHDPAYGRGPLLDIAAARQQAAERMK
jgi:simple sugar transport system ATP-binding protein